MGHSVWSCFHKWQPKVKRKEGGKNCLDLPEVNDQVCCRAPAVHNSVGFYRILLIFTQSVSMHGFFVGKEQLNGNMTVRQALLPIHWSGALGLPAFAVHPSCFCSSSTINPFARLSAGYTAAGSAAHSSQLCCVWSTLYLRQQNKICLYVLKLSLRKLTVLASY